ncbi:MAG: hypothetical protein HSCHL_1043 [Hydrogenibacillus schlegelii]|uniref:Uncharacterized protein n=1 Tax=Hydrogenibacillus schlegelii TaxID=1484 RepID=A0A2T5G6N2_HYDSH|nr:MAG: hypothetical protein HSCHL_1043 [Hydrogenibacillus schlegelii]
MPDRNVWLAKNRVRTSVPRRTDAGRRRRGSKPHIYGRFLG